MINKFYDLWFSNLSSISVADRIKLKNLSKYDIYNNTIELNKFFNDKQIHEIKSKNNLDYISKLTSYIKKLDIFFYNESDINEILILPPECPISCLFCKGKPLKNSRPFVGIIGSRHPSKYGQQIAYELAYRLAPYCTIVSGMAMGIDHIAHEGAIDAGGYSIGVIGTGIDIVYPKICMNTYNKMMNHGTIISEFPIGTNANKWNFPIRNRIISAIVDILIVVEAKTQSGTSITVNYALEYGKDIFAVPARIGDDNSYGCLKLIKDGAYMLTTYKDILYHLNIDEIKTSPSTISDTILNLLMEKPLNLNEILSKTSFDKHKVQEILIKLEINGFIKKSISGLFTISSYK